MIDYTRHARRRMRERGIDDADVLLVLAEPDEIRYGCAGELVARKRFGRQALQVVYTEHGSTKRVITVIRR